MRKVYDATKLTTNNNNKLKTVKVS